MELAQVKHGPAEIRMKRDLLKNGDLFTRESNSRVERGVRTVFYSGVNEPDFEISDSSFYTWRNRPLGVRDQIAILCTRLAGSTGGMHSVKPCYSSRSSISLSDAECMVAIETGFAINLQRIASSNACSKNGVSGRRSNRSCSLIMPS